MTATTMPGEPDQMKDGVVAAGRHWGTFLAFGVLLIVIGVAAIGWPGATAVTIAIFFAASIFVAGLFNVVRVFDSSLDGGARALSGIVGLLGIAVGFALLRQPFQSVVVMAYVIGIFWVAHGIMDIAGAFSVRQGRGWLLFVGGISVIAGIVILQYPIGSIATLSWVVGIWLVIMGIVQVIAAFRIRSAAKRAA